MKNSSDVLESVITHPEKVFWPKEGYTKRDLLEYYQQIAPLMLPHLVGRPIVMRRYPDGIKGEDFFQKVAPKFAPEWIETVTVEHFNKKIDYLVISDVRSLLYVANLGSIEIHPFMARYPKIDYPDFLVIDIDPNDVPFEAAIEVANEVHRQFEKLKIPSYCKTSGKRGLHVYVPLGGKYAYSDVVLLAKLLATFVHEALPEMTSVIRDPAKRKNKVYIDYLQNERTKTVVAPYSVRAIEGATVSTPLEWHEVKKGLDPRKFTIKTVPSRVKGKKDLFAPVLGKGISLQSLLKKIKP